MNGEDFSLKSQTDWAHLDSISDEEIDLTDIPELTDEQLALMTPTAKFFADRGARYETSPPHTINIYHEDGTISSHLLAPTGQTIILDPDILAYFPDSKTVNNALRSLIKLIPQA